MGYGKSSLKNNTELKYLRWSAIQYSLIFHFLKGEIDSTFFGIGLGLSYSDMTYKTDNWVNKTGLEWVNDELELKGSISVPTVNLLINVGLGYPVVLQFIGSGGWVLANTEIAKVQVKSGVFSFGLGMNFGFYPMQAILVSASPAIAIVEDNQSFGMNIGLVILTNKL